jgi:hypothetical protein
MCTQRLLPDGRVDFDGSTGAVLVTAVSVNVSLPTGPQRGPNSYAPCRSDLSLSSEIMMSNQPYSFYPVGSSAAAGGDSITMPH